MSGVIDFIMGFVKSVYNEQLIVHARKTLRLIKKLPFPSMVLVFLGLSLGSYLTVLFLESREENLQARLGLCKEQQLASKEQYEQNIKIKESTIQLYSLLASKKEIGDEIPIYNPKSDNKLVVPDNSDPSQNDDGKKIVDEPPALTSSVPDDVDPIIDETAKTAAAPKCSAEPITAQALAGCLLLTANTYNIPAAVLIGIMHVEGGRVGEETRNKDGSYSLGPYKINSKIIPKLAGLWEVKPDAAKIILRDNACVNTRVAAWLLAENVNQAKNLFDGIALYHSSSKKDGEIFASKVVSLMMEKGLVRQDNTVHDGSSENLVKDDDSNGAQAEKKGVLFDFLKIISGG